MPKHTARARPYPNNIRSLIRLYGYKVVEVADELRIPRSTLYDYLSGNRPAPRACLRELAHFLGCDLSEFRYEQVADSSYHSPGAPASVPQAESEKSTPDDMGHEAVSVEELPPQQAVGLPFSLMPLRLDLPSTDYAAWFGMKLAQLFTLITHGEAGTCRYRDLQARLNKEIMMFDAMKPHTPREDYTISRRQAIIAIAGLPVALLAAVQQGHWSVLVKEEFLSRCAASITACWHLMAGREFGEVERALSNYLPVLMTWAHQPAPQQKAIADLAAQGNILMSLVALHTLRVPNNLQVRIAYCERAGEYAKLSENHDLHATTLTHLGGTLGEAGQPAEMLQKLLEARQYLKDVSLLVQNKLSMELARAYAWNGQVQEALRCIGDARATLPAENTFVPIFLSGDSGLSHLLLMEGQTHLSIGEQQPESDHYDQAETVLAQIETLPSTVVIPERFRIEIFNQQALAAMKTQNLERFCFYFEKGIQGAKALGSQQRRQEAVDLYWQGRKLWSHEGRVKDLADLFISMN